MNKVMVKIQGAEYPMVGDKSEQHMLKVADFVDKEMSKVIESNPRLSLSMASIVAAINITDILFECSEINDELTTENHDLKGKIGTPDEKLKLEVEKLKQDLGNKSKEVESDKAQIQDLLKQIENHKLELDNLKNKKEGSKEELENYKLQVEELKTQAEEANERATIAESLASEFQNKAYSLQLKFTELENEVKYLRAAR
ncbi:cell division protein ZapA [Romboutsia maritimum]|uniref:Cell division protein ZapA n=1 Tax=Romboutsia maritimum TaxID=2020948 RepID=A0A255HXP5_9FIRM|nr:cell division protein ZapA [Romboutsia maritimum]RDY24128.1 cell division protein ZapA [Romboutsia maritimum]